MSWSLALSKIPRDQAKAASEAEHQKQFAYQTDGSHKGAMDAASLFVAAVAAAMPEGREIGVTSWGHFNTEGTGEITVTVHVSKPIPPPAPASPEA